MKNTRMLWLIVIAVVLIVVAWFIISVDRSHPSIPTVSGDVVGKYAYNKTNGQYRGKIVGQKSCRTESELQCYEIEGELGIHEAPIDNIVVKNNLR